MTDLQADLLRSGLPIGVLRPARAAVPALVQRITAQVQHEVRSFAGPSDGRRRKLIEMAVTAAVTHFLDSIEQPTTSGRAVDELFRRMGHGEATDGHDLDAMHAAFRIANQEAWRHIRTVVAEQGLPPDILGRLGDAMFAYIDHLAEQIELGFDETSRMRAADPAIARRQLLDGLLEGASLAEIQVPATKAGWALPGDFVVVVVQPVQGQPMPSLADLGGTDLNSAYLVDPDPLSTVIVCAAGDLTALLEAVGPRLEGAAGGLRLATSWPVPREDIPAAWRWADRALDLVTRGVIATAPVIDCAEHRAQIWLHSEPALRQRLCQELLSPLLAETPNSREILSETLLAWLESRDSAPAIGAKLGVHPQTVRYRWKRVNELFDEQLHDPEFVIQVTMLLKASVPLWKAGDQSDFERFRAEDAG